MSDMDKVVEEHSEKIINLIEKLYEELGYTQVTWGEKLGYTQGKISHLKNKRNRISMEYILKSAEALGVSVVDLLEAVRTNYDQDDVKLILKMHEAIRNKKTDPTRVEYIKKMLL